MTEVEFAVTGWRKYASHWPALRIAHVVFALWAVAWVVVFALLAQDNISMNVWALGLALAIGDFVLYALVHTATLLIYLSSMAVTHVATHRDILPSTSEGILTPATRRELLHAFVELALLALLRVGLVFGWLGRFAGDTCCTVDSVADVDAAARSLLLTIAMLGVTLTALMFVATLRTLFIAGMPEYELSVRTAARHKVVESVLLLNDGRRKAP